MKKILALGIVLVLLLAGVGTVSAANLVSNGGFESLGITGDFTSLPAGNTGLTGWTISDGGIDHIKAYWKAAEGSQSVDLSRQTRGTISQLITTPSGTYQLSFSMSGNPVCIGLSGDTNKIKDLEVYWDNTLVGTPSFDSSVITAQATDMHWKTVTISVTSSTENPVLRFKDVSTGNDPRCGVALDDISVERTDQTTPVPEFPSIALPAALIVGLIGAVLFIRKSKEN